MPAPKRTRNSAVEDVDNHDTDSAETAAAITDLPETTPPRATPRRSPPRRTTSTPALDPAAPSTPARPSRATPRARLVLSSSPCPNASTPSATLRSASSLFPPGANSAPLAGPSTRGGTLTRAASTSAVPSVIQMKEAAGNGGAPPPVKGNGGDDLGPDRPRRFGKGKENVPPPKDPSPLPTPPSESSRKRVRVARDGRSVRSASAVSMRSESLGPSSFVGLARRPSSCLPSPSPTPSKVPSQDGNAMDLDRTPTKAKYPAQQLVMTPPPSSPLTGELEHAIEGMAVCSRAPSLEPTATRAFSNAYRGLKAALRLSSATGKGQAAIVGRDDEKAILGTYLGLVSTCDVGMYISGPPGTGKTALTTAAGRDLEAAGWRVIEIGVMGLKATDLWTRIGAELQCGQSEEEVINRLRTSDTPTFIILDEIDSLLPPAPALPPPATSHVLSKLFSLPLLSSTGAKVKLVAISNTLDLTVRANLVLAGGAMPQVLPFKAYNASDMAKIVNVRVDAASHGPDAAKVEPRAIELLSRKVEAQSGDLRMCLGVLSTAVGMAEADWMKKKAGDGIAPLIKVALPHILKAFASHTKELRAAAGSSSTGTTSPTASKIRSIPLHGRMVLVSLLIFLMRTRVGLSGCPAHGATSDTATTSTLYATYAHLLSHESSPFPPSPESDYRDLLSNLETLGLVALVRSRGAMRVDLCVREEEAKAGLGLAGDAAGRAEEEVARVWVREESRVERARAKARNAFQRAEEGFMEA